MGKNVSFDVFREKHPEYPESLRECYFESVVYGPEIVLQNSFCVDLKDREVIDTLLKIRMPEYIYCGTSRLVKALGKAYPQLIPLIRLHGWYEESICMVMHATKRALQPKAEAPEG